MTANSVGGIEAFDLAEAQDVLLQNKIATISGLPTTGKTQTALRTKGRRYFVSLDPNPMWRLSIAESVAMGYDDVVYPLRFDPMEYILLTPDEALKRLKKIENFARMAREEGKRGTFIIDGGTIWKGYVERAYLGESVTLGWRPKKGEKDIGIGTFQYATRNSIMRDFLGCFVGSDLDVLVTFEGSFYNGKFKSSKPAKLDYVSKLNIETAVAVVESNVNGQTISSYEHMMVFDNNPYVPGLAGYAMPLKDWEGIKKQLARGMPDLSELIAESQLRRVNTEVMEVDDATDTANTSEG